MKRSSFEEQFDFATSFFRNDRVFSDARQAEILEKIRKEFQGLSSSSEEAALSIQDLIDAEDDLDFALKDVSEGMEESGNQGGFLIDVMSGLGDTLKGIGPAAQNTFGVFGTSLVQSTQTGEQGMNDLLDTSQNFFRNFLTDTQRTTRSAAGAFQNFARSARGAVSDSLFALLRGDMKRFGEVWKNFANSLLDSLVNTGVKLAQGSLFSFLGIDGGGSGDFLGSLAKEVFGTSGGGGGGSGGGGSTLNDLFSLGRTAKSVVDLFAPSQGTGVIANLGNILGGFGVDAAASPILTSLFGVSSAGTAPSAALAAVNADLAASGLFAEFTGTAVAAEGAGTALGGTAAAASEAGGALAGVGGLAGAATIAGAALLAVALVAGKRGIDTFFSGITRGPEAAGQANISEAAGLLGVPGDFQQFNLRDANAGFAAAAGAIQGVLPDDLAQFFQFLQDPSGGLGVSEKAIRDLGFNPDAFLGRRGDTNALIGASPQFAAAVIRSLQLQRAGGPFINPGVFQTIAPFALNPNAIPGGLNQNLLNELLRIPTGLRTRVEQDAIAQILDVLNDPGDAVGRFVTKPSLRLIGEGGPEHVFNVNSPQSVDFFRQGVRPIIREIFKEERGAMSGSSVRVDLRGAFFPDSRSVEKLFRLLEDFRRGRRISGRGIA